MTNPPVAPLTENLDPTQDHSISRRDRGQLADWPEGPHIRSAGGGACVADKVGREKSDNNVWGMVQRLCVKTECVSTYWTGTDFSRGFHFLANVRDRSLGMWRESSDALAERRSRWEMLYKFIFKAKV